MIRHELLPPALRGRLSRLGAHIERIAATGTRRALQRMGPIVRRGIDLVVGGAGLVAVAPVVGCAALAVRATSPGPAFYRQTRIGKDARPFVLRKLRTMHVDADARRAALEAQNESKGGVTFKIRVDPRVTRVGRVLRKLSIDELPQLWNLVTGTMTLFGPRPPVPEEVARYGGRERRRLEVKPGLTCLWQVSGRSDLTFHEQVALDIAYIDHAGPSDELRILARTIPAVISGRGAY